MRAGLPGFSHLTLYPALKLLNHDLCCELQPALGGCIAGLWWRAVPVLQSTPAHALQSVRQAASYPLLPYSNRMSAGVLQWQGQAYPLAKNWVGAPHSIHGVGWERTWSVLAHTSHTATLGYQHGGDASWPFAFDATQTFQLGPQGLAMTMTITNRASHDAPAGLGWHPYFVKRPGAHIHFDAQARWEMGPDQLPTERLASTGLQTDVTDLLVDHCFDVWSGNALLRDDVLSVRVDSDLRHLVVYTLPQRGDIAIEPVSHSNNAFNRYAAGEWDAQTLGVKILGPGASLTCAMGITVYPTVQENL